MRALLPTIDRKLLDCRQSQTPKRIIGVDIREDWVMFSRIDFLKIALVLIDVDLGVCEECIAFTVACTFYGLFTVD